MRRLALAVLTLAALTAWLIVTQPNTHRIEPPLAPYVDPHYPPSSPLDPQYPAISPSDPHYPPTAPVDPHYGSR